MKDTATRMRERQQAEAKKMMREALIICGTIIALTVIIIVVLARLQ